MSSIPCLQPSDNPSQPIQIQNKIFIVGRSPKCSILIQHPSISKEHTQITPGDRPQIKDLNSLNGTFVNGVRLGKGQMVDLGDEDQIQFGKYPIIYTFYCDTLSAFMSNQSNLPQPQIQVRQEAPPQQVYRDVKISLLDYVNEKNQQLIKQRDQVQRNQNQQQQIIQDYQRETQIPPQPVVERIYQPIQYLEQKQIEQSLSYLNQQLQIQNQEQEAVIKTLNDRVRLLQTENLEVRDKLILSEEESLRKDNDYNLLKQNNLLLTEEKDRLNAKLKTLETFVSDLQRKYDQSLSQNQSLKYQLDEMRITDVGKRFESLNVQYFFLKKLLNQKNEVGQLKGLLTQKQEDGQKKPFAFSQGPSYINQDYNQTFLESQSKEISQMRKIIQEYENRQNDYNLRIQGLMQENKRKDEQVKGHQVQIGILTQNIQDLNQQYDKKIQELSFRVLQIIDESGDEKQKAAAFFLVEQIQNLQEELRQYQE